MELARDRSEDIGLTESLASMAALAFWVGSLECVGITILQASIGDESAVCC